MDAGKRNGDTMKRTPELRSLSEDHHHGLVHARRLRRATEADEADSAESVARGFLNFWQKDTALHFRKEEEVLLPVMARYKGDLSRQPLLEMLEDHARIRGLVMQLSDEAIAGNVRLETLHEIAERLEAHIRLEERVVFPLIEQSLSEAALTNWRPGWRSRRLVRVSSPGSLHRSSPTRRGRVPATARAAATTRCSGRVPLQQDVTTTRLGNIVCVSTFIGCWLLASGAMQVGSQRLMVGSP
jgi:hypothetical protein